MRRSCIFEVAGSCDNPQNNKGNSDAAFFRMSNKSMVTFLIVSVLKRA